jgi:hypothetical protein
MSGYSRTFVFLACFADRMGPGENFIIYNQSRLDGVCREIPRATVLNYRCAWHNNRCARHGHHQMQAMLERACCIAHDN